MLCFVDYRISNEEYINLKKQNLIVLKVPKSNLLYDAINGHVDIQFNILDKKNKKVIVNKDISKEFLNTLSNFNIEYVLSNTSLSSKYPNDIILNALITDEFLLHNLSFTDKNILINTSNKSLIDVKQGYSKCSVLPVTDKAFITSDIPIYNALKANCYDCLLVPPGDIILPGLDYGFIGGTGGLINKSTIAFFGNLKFYKYGNEVLQFLNKHNIKPIYLSNGKLIDRGSIFTL